MSDGKVLPPGPGTLAVHGGEPAGKDKDSLTQPVFLTSSYVFDSTAELRKYFEGGVEREEYGRYGNPTVRAAERKIAVLEGTEDCVLFSTGMAAVTTALLAALRSGQHVILTSDCYRRTRQFVEGALSRFGVESTIVEPGDLQALDAAVRPGQTRMVITESPTNPYCRVIDLKAVSELCRRYKGLKLMVDATLATPVNQQTAALGVDFVVHSATKYMGGHNDLLAGAVCGSAPLMAAVREFRGLLGAMLDPQTAYLLIRGLKTLDVRVRRQNETAQRVAAWLERQPKIERMYYPGLESHPDYAIARRQMTGFGGLMSFVVQDGLAGASRFVDGCKLAIHAASLGGVETLIQLPAIMSYNDLTPEQRKAIGVDEGLVRLAVGLEDADDIIADMTGGLAAV
jgi:cystathionine gamma-synthase